MEMQKMYDKIPYKIISRNIALGIVMIFLIIAISSRVSMVLSKGGTYLSTEHGGTDANTNGVTGVSRPPNTPAGYTINTTDYPAGNCIHCHDEHSSNEGATHTPEDYMIFDPGGANKNRFCYTCHTNKLTIGGAQYGANNQVWQGQVKYDTSGHSISASTVWPGPSPAARTAAEAGKCVNCHEQHGATFGYTGDNRIGQATYALTDPIPQMLSRSEENLCFGCHSTTAPATTGNIQSLFSLGVNASPDYYTHPINRNTAANDRSPSRHNILESKKMWNAHTAGPPQQTERHVECVDCHNPHYAGYNAAVGSNSHTLGTNVASPALYGTWGVRTAGAPSVKASWPSGAAPAAPPNHVNAAPALSLNYIDETGTDYEWELCLRCHSSYSEYPAFAGVNALTDISREINPNNLSHHALVRPGNNQLTSAAAAVRTQYDGAYTIANPRNATIYCSDCHTTDMGSALTAVDGPHGSTRKFIVGSWCETRGGSFGTANCADPMQTSICYKCHKYDIYWGGTCNAAGCSRGPMHDGNHQQGAASVYGSHLHCMVCHGGGVAGGIHGTNESPGVLGSGGQEPRGNHFMNGACLESFDYKNAMGRVECWTVTAATAYCVAGPCIGKHSSGSATPNYDYCEPVCPGT